MSETLDRLRAAKRVGLLLSGGSARCSFQIGVIETLFSLGIQPAVCLGVSAGAWNAAAVATGNWPRLRYYWRFFCRMPYIDLFNLLREHSPFLWPRLHKRAFDRYVGNDAIKASPIPLLVAVTRLRDRTQIIFDAREAEDPFRILLASNYLPPFYTHPPDVDGEQYGDGGFTNNIPYEVLFDHGCDAVLIVSAKGESEGNLYRNSEDWDHVIPEPYRDRTVVIRPRHRLPVKFVERRWKVLGPIADLGALRAREVLLGERHPETDLSAGGMAFTMRVMKLRQRMRAR